MPTVSLELPRAGMNQHELVNYIIRLVEELNYTLNNLDGQNVGATGIPVRNIANFSGQSIKVMQAEFDKVRAGKIEANYITSLVAQFAMAAIKKATIEAANIKDLTAETLKAVLAELEKVSAGSIETNTLYAELVKAIRADLGRVTAGYIETSELYAILGEVVNLAAKAANIGFAQIEGLTAGKALISKGEAGKLYIADLAVTDANILSLTVGQLVVKDKDGRYYQMAVNPESEKGFDLLEVQMDGDQLAGNSVSGGKILESSITTRELNVEEIFADTAIIRKIFAGYGQFGEVEAIEGFIATLETQLIQSGALKVLVGGDIGSFRTEVNLRTDSLEARVESNEKGIYTLQTAVVVDEKGLTLKQPSKTSSELKLDAEGLSVVDGGRGQLYINADESFVPNLRVETFTMGSLKTTVTGEGENCHIVEQYLG